MGVIQLILILLRHTSAKVLINASPAAYLVVSCRVVSLPFHLWSLNFFNYFALTCFLAAASLFIT